MNGPDRLDPAERAAIIHYEALIAERVPPHLAAHLAAARYQVGLMRQTQADPLPTIEYDALPIVRETLVRVQDRHPTLRRTAGQLVEKIEHEMGVSKTIHRRNSRRS